MDDEIGEVLARKLRTAEAQEREGQMRSFDDYIEQQRTIIEEQERSALVAHLVQAQSDIKHGKVQPMQSAIADIYKTIDNIDS